MSSADLDILEAMVTQRESLTLSLPSAGISYRSASRFVCMDRCDPGGGVWVEAAEANQRLLIQELIRSGRPCVAHFAWGRDLGSFTSRILDLVDGQRLPVRNGARAMVLLNLPSQIDLLQRRAHYRSRISPDDTHAMLSLKPLSLGSIDRFGEVLRLSDLSVGGAGLVAAGTAKMVPALLADTRVGVQLDVCGISILLHGQLRHRTPQPCGNLRIGIRFVDLAHRLDGRRTLTRLSRVCAMLQQREARQAYLRFGHAAA